MFFTAFICSEPFPELALLFCGSLFLMINPIVDELLSIRAEAVKQLSAVDLFQPLARLQVRVCEAQIRIIDAELKSLGWVWTDD